MNNFQFDTNPNYSTVLVLRNLYNKYPAKCVNIAQPLKET